MQVKNKILLKNYRYLLENVTYLLTGIVKLLQHIHENCTMFDINKQHFKSIHTRVKIVYICAQ